MTDQRRSLPSVNALLESDELKPLLAHFSRTLVADAVRDAVDAARTNPASAPATPVGWARTVETTLARRERPSLRPLYNATGVILHTNLGRSPLAARALDAIRVAAEGACNLEYDLEAGTRGSRYTHAVSLLRDLTGAEDAIVVNNCAAALVLALNTFADGREAIVSRGELIEIGGSFRVPDIMTRSGATLAEVGTTNRTHLEDYTRAIGARTGAIVKVHRSNFELRGFVADVAVRELAVIAREHDLPLLHDFGSGLLISLEPWGLPGEPVASDAVRDGATLVLMSGDKLMGGPQAGVMVGAAHAIAACRRNPLARALRVDKLTLAALEATLALARDPERAVREIPTLAMLTAPVAAIRARTAVLRDALAARGIVTELVETEATVGGGAFPTARIASAALGFAIDPERVEARLRLAEEPVIGRIERGRLLLDVRSVPAALDDALGRAIAAALA